MKIICDSCGAKYTVSDDKVQGKTVKVKCRKCSAVIVVSSSGDVSTTGGPAVEGSSDAADATFTVAVTDNDQRTMTLEEIVFAYNDGTIDAETFVWAEGMDDWQPLREVDQIVDALHEAAGQAEDEAPEQQEDMGATIAMPDGMQSPFDPVTGEPLDPALAAPMAPAAAAEPSAPTASAPAALGSGPSAPGAANSAPVATASAPAANASAPAAPSPSSPTEAAAPSPGKVDENSAIFSLNMLTAKAGSADSTSSPSSNFSGDEDSGLIDLKALSAGMGSSPGASDGGGGIAAEAGLGGVFPLGAPPPPTEAVEAAAEKPKKGKGLLIGIMSVLVIGLTATVVYLVMKSSGKPEAPIGTATAATATAKPSATETTSATEVASATPTATATTTATSTTSAKVAAGKGYYRPKKTGTGKGTNTAKPPVTGKKPPVKVGGCGCKPTDLICNMKCGTK